MSVDTTLSKQLNLGSQGTTKQIHFQLWTPTQMEMHTTEQNVRFTDSQVADKLPAELNFFLESW